MNEETPAKEAELSAIGDRKARPLARGGCRRQETILAYGHPIALAQQLVGSLALAGDI